MVKVDYKKSDCNQSRFPRFFSDLRILIYSLVVLTHTHYYFIFFTKFPTRAIRACFAGNLPPIKRSIPDGRFDCDFRFRPQNTRLQSRFIWVYIIVISYSISWRIKSINQVESWRSPQFLWHQKCQTPWSQTFRKNRKNILPRPGIRAFPLRSLWSEFGYNIGRFLSRGNYKKEPFLLRLSEEKYFKCEEYI